MLISLGTWLNLLQWSRFPITFSPNDIVCHIKFTITTKRLSLKLIPENNQKRHRLILNLSDKGYSDKEISIYLNSRKIQTPRRKSYSPQLVWVTRKKLRLRDKRKNETNIRIDDIRFCLKTKII